MELDSILLGLKILWVALGTYFLVFGFVKKINEWIYVSRLGVEKIMSLPPGDMGWPILGHTFSFYSALSNSTRDPDSFLSNMIKRYGRTGVYKTHLFRSPTIMVSAPDTCRKVLTDDESFRPDYSPLISEWWFNMPTTEHKHARRLLKAPINGHDELSMYMEYIEECMITCLDEMSSMKEPVELLKVMKEVTLMVIASFLCGPATAKTLMGLMVKHFDTLTIGLYSVPINLPGLNFNKALQARKALVKILQSHVLDQKRKAKSNPIKDDQTKKRGLVDILMETEDGNGYKFTDTNIIDLMLGFLLAGHETTANTVTWAMIYMHEHPEVLQKAKEEQEEIVKKRPSTQKGLTLKEFREMNYLQKVIDETLRLSNIIFANFREAKVDTNVNGYLIPKGWKVIAWSRGVNMDPEIHPNPKEFNVERWENNKLKAGSFLPFGAGGRSCLGADFARLEISIFLHHFLLNYKLEKINPTVPTVYLHIPRPADNCLVRIIKVQ